MGGVESIFNSIHSFKLIKIPFYEHMGVHNCIRKCIFDSCLVLSTLRLPCHGFAVMFLSACYYQASPSPPCLFVPFCVLRCDLFLDSISALTASVSLLIQIRLHLRCLSYASHCTFIQAHWLGLFFLRCWYGLLHAPVFASCMPRTLPWWISAFDATNKAFHFDGILSQCSHSAWSLSFLLVRQSCLLRLWVERRDRCIKKKGGKKERKL